MSNFIATQTHPITKKTTDCRVIDNCFGSREFGYWFLREDSEAEGVKWDTPDSEMESLIYNHDGSKAMTASKFYTLRDCYTPETSLSEEEPKTEPQKRRTLSKSALMNILELLPEAEIMIESGDSRIQQAVHVHYDQDSDTIIIQSELDG